MTQSIKIIIATLLIIVGIMLTFVVLDVISFDDLKDSAGKIGLVALIVLGVTAGLSFLSSSNKK